MFIHNSLNILRLFKKVKILFKIKTSYILNGAIKRGEDNL